VAVVEQGWLSDNEGRIENISLAPNLKNALFPLFEAVMNAIHAIEERFGRDHLSEGRIHITAHKDRAGEYCGFTITDNGIGFTSDNLTSLRKFDSRKKAKLGGKGVGRLLWLKVADTAAITSIFEDAPGKLSKVSFNFTVSDPVAGLSYEEPGSAPVGTKITINPFVSKFATRLPKKLETFANRLIAHFVSYFANIAHPEIVISDDNDTVDLFDSFSEKVERDKDYPFEIEGIEFPFLIHCFLLPKTISDDEKSVNALYLGANGRAVSRHELDSVLGMKAVDGKYAFLGYVESDYLNKNANDTRTAFSLDEDQVNQIIDTAKQKAKEFLEPEIKKIREKQASRILSIGREHPRFFYAARHAEEVAETLHLSNQSEEEIFVELSRGSLRDYKIGRASCADAFKNGLPNGNCSPGWQERVAAGASI
jgi:hypothetical protein